MTRLRRVSAQAPGWIRRRCGRGFVYLDGDSKRLPQADVDRIKALAIPPAWSDVWICPQANGHLQAVGTDDAWREGRQWHDLSAAELNEHIHELFGMDATAKDFRTWHATVIVADALASVERAATVTKRRRQVREAIASLTDPRRRQDRLDRRVSQFLT